MAPPDETAIPPALWTLGYVSVAIHALAPGQLEHILHSSRRDNPVYGVTGLLVHCEGTFMQVLEGPREGVHEIFRRIQANPVHTSIHVLFDERIEHREFGGWSMACKDVGSEALQPVLRAPAGSTRRMLAEYWRAWS
jgi:hypothetical protein